MLNRTLDLLPQMYSFPNLPHFMATLSFWLLRACSHSYSLSLSFPHFLPPPSYILNLLARCGCAASLACYSSWGLTEADTTSWLKNNSLQTTFRIWPLFINLTTAVAQATPCCLLGPRTTQRWFPSTPALWSLFSAHHPEKYCQTETSSYHSCILTLQ